MTKFNNNAKKGKALIYINIEYLYFGIIPTDFKFRCLFAMYCRTEKTTIVAFFVLKQKLPDEMGKIFDLMQNLLNTNFPA